MVLVSALTLVTPLLLVIPRSACGVRVSVSVALLLLLFGSNTALLIVAVLLRLPVAEALIVQLAVCVTDAPDGRLTELLILPLPDAVQVPPPAPTQVQVHVSDAGKVSLTVAPVTGSGPALLAMIV